MTAFEKEYTIELVDIIEFVYGQNYLSQGGPESVDTMLAPYTLQNKVLADIGCGTGGPVLHIAKNHPIKHIIGVDVDPDLLGRANVQANKQAITDRVTWVQSTPEAPLPIESNSVDIVLGKESWLHIQDKLGFFREVLRILKPGGAMVCIDWMHRDDDYSDLMNNFVYTDGLTFHLCNINKYLETIAEAGFTDLEHTETSDQALAYSRHDVDLLLDTKTAAEFADRFGETTYTEWLCSWLMQCEIFARGDMQTFLIRAVKPK